jgi:nucleoside-diphosphate-sugar epimerase
MTIYLTGSNGFIGTSLRNYFGQDCIRMWKRNDEFNFIGVSAVINLAGKSQDLKKTDNPDEYYHVNTDFSNKLYDAFLKSDAKVFITLSSVKAVADSINGVLTEENHPNPLTHYGKSKLLAEQYIFSNVIPPNKRVYVLRPCMVHGSGNKGNLNLLYNVVSKNIPWPLGAFDNKRSFCSIDNLMFIFKELLERDDIPSGIYNVADDEPISTNDLISLIAQSQNTKTKIWKVSKGFINFVAKIGDNLHLPINTERLQKLTDSYIVSNDKIKNAIGKNLSFSTREGLLHTFLSFKR